MHKDKVGPPFVGANKGRNSKTRVDNTGNKMKNQSCPSPKIKPSYSHLFDEFPNADPIFIAIDKPCFHLIGRLSGICLLCERESTLYDLSICCQHEAWVLYSNPASQDNAKALALSALKYGASKATVNFIDKNFFWSNDNV